LFPNSMAISCSFQQYGQVNIYYFVDGPESMLQML